MRAAEDESRDILHSRQRHEQSTVLVTPHYDTGRAKVKAAARSSSHRLRRLTGCMQSSSAGDSCAASLLSCSCKSCQGIVFGACLLHTDHCFLPAPAPAPALPCPALPCPAHLCPALQVEESDTEPPEEEPDAYDSLSHFLPATGACAAHVHSFKHLPDAAGAGCLPA